MKHRALVVFLLGIVFLPDFLVTIPMRRRHAYLIQEIMTQPGEEIILYCEITNVTGPIKWLSHDEPLKTSNQTSRIETGVNRTSGQHFLKILHVIPEDDGIWHCQEQRKKEQMLFTSKPIRVIVTVPPQKPYLLFEERRLKDEAIFTIKEKNTVTFHCIISQMNPAPDYVEWVVGDINMTSVSRLVTNFYEKERVYHGKSSLTFEVNRTHHRKMFRCIVHHIALKSAVTASLTFNILYSPSFSITRIPGFGYPIYEGIFVALKCDVDANPPSQAQWIKDDRPLPDEVSSDGYLNFTVISRTDSGWYRCSTRHEFGSFTSFGYFLNIRYGPEIVQQSPPQVEVGVGGTVMLECAADGKPPPSYCWAKVKNGGSLESMGMEQNLLLDRILYTDAGTYKCFAFNNNGIEHRRADSHDIELVVTGLPRVDPVNRTSMSVVGRSAVMSAHFCANPPATRSSWIIHNQVLAPGESRGRFHAKRLVPSENAHCYISTLHILDVKPEDAGELLFIVKNSRGIDDAAIWLNITQASFSISAGVQKSTQFTKSLMFIFVILLTVRLKLSYNL